MVYSQVFRLMIFGEQDDEDNFYGELAFDMAQYAFKGFSEQEFSLSLHLRTDEHAESNERSILATAKGYIICRAAQKVLQCSSSYTLAPKKKPRLS